ncbi:DUF2795 domain-containing protein [Candidatus Nitrospira bockiana]
MAHAEKAIPNPIQIQKFLGGIDYPTDKATLIKTAREKGADENVLNALNEMRAERYNSPNDVSEEIGKLR